jgi:hypothetical protein
MKTLAEQVVHADGTSGHGNAPSEAPYRSAAERRAEGKRLRDAVPRAELSSMEMGHHLTRRSATARAIMPIRPSVITMRS